MNKIMNDTQCSLDQVLYWVLNEKNSLQNTSGFLPFQLVLRRNLNFHQRYQITYLPYQ